MSSRKFLMDKGRLIQLFSKLDGLLKENDETLEFWVSGGASMCLHLQTRHATHDIDASPLGGDKNVVETLRLQRYADKLSKMFNLPSNWLNVGGNMHITEPMKKTSVLGFKGSRLTVHLLDWQSMLVLKIMAYREQPDITDAVAIIRKYNVQNADEIYEWMKNLRPDWMHMGSMQQIKNMLKEAWDTPETPYIKLRTLLDTYGFRDKTVNYYTALILDTHEDSLFDDDDYEEAISLFYKWKEDLLGEDNNEDFPESNQF